MPRPKICHFLLNNVQVKKYNPTKGIISECTLGIIWAFPVEWQTLAAGSGLGTGNVRICHLGCDYYEPWLLSSVIWDRADQGQLALHLGSDNHQSPIRIHVSHLFLGPLTRGPQCLFFWVCFFILNLYLGCNRYKYTNICVQSSL